MSTGETEEFNEIQFEKKLTGLKDSQDSINICCQWCLSNRQHHKKIVNSWLNVLKRVKVEQRLVLFYLANDVIQYSKRKKYDFVESWGTALQKATTLVRDDRVKQKIQRIFKIWEDRGVYTEDFISDLCGLISVTPTAPKNDEPHEFQANYVINKIRICANLENDTDLKLKKLKELHPKIIETENFFTTLKDRAHLDDTEKELDAYINSMEEYINALKVEVKNRITLISVLKQAETQLDTDRKDVKIVANAYKTFGTKVKTFQKRLEEHKIALSSPIPSPDVNAPSPTSDNDIDLPDGLENNATKDKNKVTVQITNANYYNPVPAPMTTDSSNSQYASNGFTTFMGSSLPFNIQNFSEFNANNSSESFPSLPPPLPKTDIYPSYPNEEHTTPLLPPPMPPFETKDDATSFGSSGYNDYNPEIDYGSTSFNASFGSEAQYPPTYNNSNAANTSYDPIATLFSREPPIGANPYPPQNDEYNPEDELQTWENDMTWVQPPPLDSTETPESPPPFEKEAFGKPVEYHDNVRRSGAVDVDQRILPPNLNRTDKLLGRGQDVDHRNLISLIGSPDINPGGTSNDSSTWPQGKDRDYRLKSQFLKNAVDQDYRLPFDVEQQLKLPPPPPPPPSTNINTKKQFPPQDNVESIDMDLSDEEMGGFGKRDNLRIVIDGGVSSQTSSVIGFSSINSPEAFGSQQNSQDGMSSFSDHTSSMLEPPPPLPELPDDAEENLFLDQMNNEINDFLFNPEEMIEQQQQHWNNEMPLQNRGHIGQFPNNLPPPLLSTPINFENFNPHSGYQFDNGGPGGPYHRGGGKQNKRRGKFNNNNNRGRNNREFHNRNGGNGGFRERGRGFRGGGGGGSRMNFRGNQRGHF